MKIWGNIVGNVSPNANWDQTDPSMADYISGKKKVDEAIEELKQSSKAQYKQMQVVLKAGAWKDNKQTVTAEGVTATALVIPAPEPSAANFEVYTGCNIRAVAQGNNELMFQCDDLPGDDVTVNVAVWQ